MKQVFLKVSRLVSAALLLTVVVVSVDQEVAVKYKTHRTCVLEGSSVSIACSYSCPKGHKVTATHWFKGQSVSKVTHDLLQDLAFGGRVEYLGDMTQSCSVRITDLRKEDSGVYWFVFETDRSGKRWSSSSGFTLVVTDTAVEVLPGAEVTEGEAVDLSCGLCVLSEAPVYVWLRDDEVVARPERTNQLLLNPARVDDTGAYSCKVVGHETVPSHPVRLTVKCDQRLQVKGSPGQVREGGRVELTCGTTCPINGSLATFTWLKDGRLISGPNRTGQRLILDAVMAEDTGRYSCQRAEEKKLLSSSAVDVSVQYSPKNTKAILLGVPLDGASVILTCSSDANPPVESYTWFKVNESTPVGSGQQYSITNIRPEGGGQYYCEASNTIGSEKSSKVLIAPQVLPGEAGFPIAVVVGTVAVILVAVLVGVAVFCGLKRRNRMPESGGCVAVDKAVNPGRPDNTYSAMELKPASSDYENVREVDLTPNPSDGTYSALDLKCQSSEYETLASARSTVNASGKEPDGDDIYETLDELMKSG